MSISGVLGWLILLIFIPHSKQTKKEASLRLSAYILVLKNKFAMVYILLAALLMATYYTFVGMASLLFIEGLGLTLSEFGVYMAIATLTFGIPSIFSGKLIKLVGKKHALFAILLLLFSFVIIAALLILNEVSVPAFILFASMLFIVGMIMPVNEGFALALESAADAKGQVSALISNFKWIFTIIGVQTASYFYHGRYLSVGLTLMTMIIACILLAIFAYRKDPKITIALQAAPEKN